MKIGLDFDGVITDCGDLKSVAAKKLFNIDIPADRFKKELVINSGLLTLEQYRIVQKTIYNDLGMGLGMKPVKDALRMIRNLQKRHSISIITSRDPESVKVAEAWMFKNKLSIPIIGVGQETSKALALNGYDIFVDDDLEKLAQVKNIVPNLFLFSWEYNSHENNLGGIKRVNDWINLFEEISRIS